MASPGSDPRTFQPQAPPPAGTVLPAARLVAKVVHLKDAFERGLREALARAGHGSVPPFGITSMPGGGLQVFPAGHPQHRLLEGLLGRDTALRGRFSALERAAALLRDRREADALEAGPGDPVRAFHAFWVEVTRTGISARWEDGFRAD